MLDRAIIVANDTWTPTFIMVGKLRKPTILKSYIIVSSIITGNAKNISHYIIDLGH